MKKNMKKLYSLLLVLALTVSMAAGCGKTEKSTTNSDTKKEEEVKKEEEKIPETTYPLTIKDQIGNEVTIKEQPKRIVSGYYISSSTCLKLQIPMAAQNSFIFAFAPTASTVSGPRIPKFFKRYKSNPKSFNSFPKQTAPPSMELNTFVA